MASLPGRRVGCFGLTGASHYEIGGAFGVGDLVFLLLLLLRVLRDREIRRFEIPICRAVVLRYVTPWQQAEVNGCAGSGRRGYALDIAGTGVPDACGIPAVILIRGINIMSRTKSTMPTAV